MDGVRPNSSRLRVMLGVAGICLVIFVAVKLRGQTKASNVAAFEAIDQVLKERVRDWNNGDLDGFLASAAEDDEFSFYAGKTQSKGKESVLELARKHYPKDRKDLGDLSLSDVSIELLGPESVSVHGSWHLKAENQSAQDGLFTLIFKKKRDTWRIILCHLSPGA
jgi:uncharacterized protein (TIGR02246 family)